MKQLTFIIALVAMAISAHYLPKNMTEEIPMGWLIVYIFATDYTIRIGGGYILEYASKSWKVIKAKVL